MTLDEERLQDYIDGRMSDRERAEFAAYLLANADAAGYADDLRKHNEALKLVGADVLDEPIPERFLEILKAADDAQKASHTPAPNRSGGWTKRRLAMPQAAAVALMFSVGVATGWFGHSHLNQGPTLDQIALNSGRDAYLLYAVESSFPVEFTSERATELGEWVSRVFSTKVSPPELDELGYKFIGGRVLPWSDGNFGFYLFEKEDKSRIAMVWWPRKTPPSPLSEILNYQGVRAQFWGTEGFGFAVYADEVNKDLETVTGSAFEFYGSLFGGE